MRTLETIIYTDKLDEVRTFYGQHFFFPMDTGKATTFGILPIADSKITYIDAASAGVEPSRGGLLRLGTEFPQLERARLLAEGIECGEMTVDDWGPFYGQSVRYFTMTDPSGTRMQFFEAHYGEERQLMTTGGGTGTRDVQG